MAKTKIDTVPAYIAAQPAANRAALKAVRAAVKKALPRSTEGISYRIPIVKLDGRMVLYFAAFKQHYAIYPATKRVLSELGSQVKDRLHNKSTIRFSYDDAPPAKLIARIARIRAAEAKEATAARAAKSRKTTAKKARNK